MFQKIISCLHYRLICNLAHILVPTLFFLNVVLCQKKKIYLISTNGRFADGTELPIRTCIKPLMKTRPTKQMATHRDYGISCHIQAYVTIESASYPLIITFSRKIHFKFSSHQIKSLHLKFINIFTHTLQSL